MDFHGRFTLADARRVAPLLEPLHPFFLEEPVVPENSHLIGRLAQSTSIPVATGERLFPGRNSCRSYNAGIAIAQPDLSHAGGITEVRKIASLAEVFDVQLAPHCPLGPIALAACLQVGFADTQLPHSGAEHRHPLQPRRRSARLRARQDPVARSSTDASSD